jgi:hypothetical protein
VGQLTADGLGPYDLPDATHADAQRDRDGFMHSSRLWTSENAWIPVRIHVSDDKVGKLVRQIGDARMRPDGSTIIEALMFSVCPISLANLPRQSPSPISLAKRFGTIAILPIGYLSKAVLSV